MKNIIEIIRINPKSKIPKKITNGSSGLDIRACIDNNITIESYSTKLINTGISIYIKNKNITALIIPRSGLGHKKGIILGNSIGLIDSDYQGEILISLFNRSNKKFIVKNFQRIAQIIFIPLINIKFNEVKIFKNKTKRFIHGFGHTGNK